MFSKLNYITFYITTIHVLYFCVTLMAGKRIPVFIVIDLVAVGTFLLVLHYMHSTHLSKLSVLDCLILLYILLSFGSFLNYSIPENPSSLLGFAYGIHLLVIPVFLYFSVKCMSALDQMRLLKRICILHILFMLYGYLMFYFQPTYYTSFLRDHLFAEQGVTDLWLMYSRIQSYFGSSAVGTLSWITLLLVMILNIRGWRRNILFICCIGAVLLSQQRGGMVGVFLALIYFFFLRREKLFYKIKLAVIGILCVGGMLVFVGNKYKDTLPYDLVKYTKMRFVDEIFKNNPFEERKSNREKGWEIIGEHPFGLGVGANTSGADSAGANPGGQISDANFLRIWADLGVHGISVFILIILFGLVSASKWRDPWPWGLVVLIYCIQGLGSNVFDNFYVSHLYWLLLGVIDSYRLHRGNSIDLNFADRSNMDAYREKRNERRSTVRNNCKPLLGHHRGGLGQVGKVNY